MSDRDSDDSDFSDYEDDVQQSKTPVYLGYTDGRVEASEEVGPFDNCAGGSPAWMHHDSPADEKLYTCRNCNKVMKMLVQVYAPLEDTLYDRTLYVFACEAPKCRRTEGSVRAMRGILRDEAREQDAKAQIQPFEQKLAAQPAKLFDFGGSSGGDDNPFAQLAKAEPVTKQEKKNDKAVEATKSTSRPTAVSSGKGPAFPQYHMVVEDEVLEKPKIKTGPLPEGVMDKDIESEAGEGAAGSGSSSGAAGDLEAMAKSLNMDPAFQHFVDITECNPDQIVRYGNPLNALFYSSKDKVYQAIRNCEIPGDRQVELQVMPQLIMELEDEQSLADGMEWGTIFVATSKNDAVMPTLDDNGVGYVEEWVGVQWEEEIPFTKR